MTKFIKVLAAACVLNVLGSTAVLAKVELTKDEIKAQAVDMCKAEAQKRYGKDSIVSVRRKAKLIRSASRVKWMKSMQGAMVRLVLKPESKRLASYSCLVKTDKSITFFKA